MSENTVVAERIRNIDRLWRIVDELTIRQAAALIVGCDPITLEEVSDWVPNEIHNRIAVAEHALIAAVSTGKLDSREPKSRDEGDYTYAIAVDRETKVLAVTVREWLQSKSVTDGFFFPMANSEAAYLDPRGDYYSPKLAAAVRAWEGVTTDPKYVNSRSVKANLSQWLTAHADEYGLQNEDASFNKAAIAQIAKVANWMPEGGVPPSSHGEGPPKRSALRTSSAEPESRQRQQ